MSVSVSVDELLARAEITDVLARYAHGVDRADWDLVRSCYHPDAYDDHGLYAGDLDGLLDFLRRIAGRLDATSHHLANVLVEVDDDGEGASTETSCLGRYRRTGDQAWTIWQGLRYLDRLERRHGRWAIARRTVVLDWEQVIDDAAPPAIAESWRRGGRGSGDPSHGHFGRLLEPSAAGEDRR